MRRLHEYAPVSPTLSCFAQLPSLNPFRMPAAHIPRVHQERSGYNPDSRSRHMWDGELRCAYSGVRRMQRGLKCKQMRRVLSLHLREQSSFPAVVRFASPARSATMRGDGSARLTAHSNKDGCTAKHGAWRSSGTRRSRVPRGMPPR